MSRPLKCPFCRETNAYYEVDEFNKGYVACYSCGATGPKVEARRGANGKAKSLWMKAVAMLMGADS